MKVLIVEDHRDTANLIKDQLDPMSVEVEIAESIAEMMAYMRRIPPPDLIFLDIFLPDSKTPEATLAHIKSIKSINPNAIVIVITGLPLSALPQLAIKMGADGFEFKMEINSQRKLLDVVRQQLAKAPDIRSRINLGAEVYERLCGWLSVAA